MSLKAIAAIMAGICMFYHPAFATNMIMCSPPISGCTTSSAGNMNWSMSCSSGGSIQGIAACGHYSISSTSIGSGINGVGNPEQHTYSTQMKCLCKLIYPVQTMWMYVGTFEYSRCQANCAQKCAEQIAAGNIKLNNNDLNKFVTDYNNLINVAR